MAKEFQKPVVYVLTYLKNMLPTLIDLCPSAEFVGINKEDVSLEFLQDAEILIVDCGLLSSSLILQLPNLKWVQTAFAGVDTFTRLKPTPSFVLTKFGGFFGPTMAEFVVGQIIAREKSFSLMWEAQKAKKWLPAYEISYSRPLCELTIGIIGFGEVGQEVGKYCKAMKMTVNSVQRDISSPKLPFVDNVFAVGNLSECLKKCDYFCNVLPSTPATEGLFSGSVFESCKERKSVFINIGRGDVVDESSIVNALDNDWIGGAILDVYKVEPLADDSPLWSHPKVTITPHVSGLATTKMVAELFCANFAAYQSGKPMKYVVDWNKGY